MDLGEVGAVTTALDPSQVLRAYRVGMFPMGLGDSGRAPYGWWTPQRRGVLLPGNLKTTKSLRKSMRHFDWSLDRDFCGVIRGCADSSRDGGWISDHIIEVYTELHRQGYAHSVEVWRDGRLAGGLYGVRVGRVFAGESMFHRVTDASKVALVRLVEFLDDTSEARDWLIDTQWLTSHLASLGVSEISRLDYESMLNSGPEETCSQGFPT